MLMFFYLCICRRKFLAQFFFAWRYVLYSLVFINQVFLVWRYYNIYIFFCPSKHQADSFEEAINIVNRNKYFLKFISLVVYITLLFFFLKKYCVICIWNRYGNGASIFTTSGVAARKFQSEIEAGQVRVTFSCSRACFS